jgi:hypothetical protein
MRSFWVVLVLLTGVPGVETNEVVVGGLGSHDDTGEVEVELSRGTLEVMRISGYGYVRDILPDDSVSCRVRSHLPKCRR